MTEVRTIVPGDSEWPAQLSEMPDPPKQLWVAGTGSLATLSHDSVYLTGSRSSSAYGERVASQLGSRLASHGRTIISGASYGIEAAALRSALVADGQVVAVLGHGIDMTYPRAHEHLLAKIRDNGMAVSEYRPGTVPSRSRFLRRNQLAAALSGVTLVVEAAPSSGSIQTAQYARELGRTTMAIPGPVTSKTSQGTNHLIFEGTATLVQDIDGVLSAMGLRS